MAQPMSNAPDLRPYMREKAFVGGRWSEATDGGTIQVCNPGTEGSRYGTDSYLDLRYVCMGGL